MNNNRFAPPTAEVGDLVAPPTIGSTSAIASSLGSLVIAGLLGGPLAIGYLSIRNFKALNLHAKSKQATAMFALAVALWFYSSLITPPDVISQLLTLLPQLLLWWLAAGHLMRHALSEHRAAGGKFRSKWYAAAVGAITNIVVKLAFMAHGAFI